MNHDLRPRGLRGDLEGARPAPALSGTPGGYRALQQTVDTDLLARATVWAATEPRCAGEIFNVTNGSHFRWEHLWPAIAAHFGLECGPVQTLRLADQMADKGPLWARMVERHGLRRFPTSTWWPGSSAISSGTAEYDSISDTTKLRRFGFHEIVDDEEMILRQMARLQALRIIPS